MSEELDELSKARAKKELDRFFKRHGIDENLPINPQIARALGNGKCCSGKCVGHSVSSSPKISIDDFVSIKDKKPDDGINIILIIGGTSSPKFARYTNDGYFVQGWIGATEINDDDLWLDISELTKN